MTIHRPGSGSARGIRLLVLAAGMTALSLAAAPRGAEPPSEPVRGFFREPRFIRGDVNADGKVDISDPVTLLAALFDGGAEVPCRDAADADGDLRIDITDPIFVLKHLFLGGDAPPEPGPLECGTDPRPGTLGCVSHAPCPDDFPLIDHVLHRITFGPTEELYSAIQTREDLIRYIDEQIDGVPPDYSPAIHEPELHARVESLGIGLTGMGGPAQQIGRLKSSLLVYGTRSRWQLLHVLAQFWNNHFHTQVDSLIDNFFQSPPRGGPVLRSSPAMFAAVDASPADGSLTEIEWNEFRTLHPTAIPWEEFARSRRQDGFLSQEEFVAQQAVSGWKYARRPEQAAVAALMEQREYDLYRRLAFGRFRDLTEACSKSVAMLIYLNGFENTVRAPNENFAREILELFTLGVDVVYTQRDIEELAKVFTGWTVDWVSRAGYASWDTNFQGIPESIVYPLNTREPPPFRFPTGQFWDDGAYAWAFVIRTSAHDWGRKDLFLQRYGGVDSLGNPLPSSAGVAIPESSASPTVASALGEFDLFLDRLMTFRDVAKHISTKLIQLFVTDDLSLLAKSGSLPADLQAAFDAVDLDASGLIDRGEWEEPVPLVLPNGRPPQVFERIDADGDGRITPREYQEPDLLQAAIDAWMRTGGEMREVVRTILHSDEFLSLDFRRAKVKTPFEMVTSAIRALDGDPSTAQLGLASTDLLLSGMELFSFSDPTGESELAADWMHTTGLLERLKYLNRAANPATPQEGRLAWNPSRFQARWELDTPSETVDFFTLLLLGDEILANQRPLAIEAYVTAPGDKTRTLVGFLLNLPQFQKQ